MSSSSSVRPESSASNAGTRNLFPLPPSALGLDLGCLSSDQVFRLAEAYYLACRQYSDVAHDKHGNIRDRALGSNTSSVISDSSTYSSSVSGVQTLSDAVRLPKIGSCYLRVIRKDFRAAVYSGVGPVPTFGRLLQLPSEMFLSESVLRRVKVCRKSPGFCHLGDSGDESVFRVFCFLASQVEAGPGSIAETYADRLVEPSGFGVLDRVGLRQLPSSRQLDLSLDVRPETTVTDLTQHDGFCYLRLFRSSVDRLAGVLGPFPYMSQVLRCPTTDFKVRREVGGFGVTRYGYDDVHVTERGGLHSWLELLRQWSWRIGPFPAGTIGNAIRNSTSSCLTAEFRDWPFELRLGGRREMDHDLRVGPTSAAAAKLARDIVPAACAEYDVGEKAVSGATRVEWVSPGLTTFAATGEVVYYHSSGPVCVLAMAVSDLRPTLYMLGRRGGGVFFAADSRVRVVSHAAQDLDGDDMQDMQHYLRVTGMDILGEAFSLRHNGRTIQGSTGDDNLVLTSSRGFECLVGVAKIKVKPAGVLVIGPSQRFSIDSGAAEIRRFLPQEAHNWFVEPLPMFGRRQYQVYGEDIQYEPGAYRLPSYHWDTDLQFATPGSLNLPADESTPMVHFPQGQASQGVQVSRVFVIEDAEACDFVGSYTQTITLRFAADVSVKFIR